MERTGLYKKARPWILCLVILCVLLSEHVAIGDVFVPSVNRPQ